LQGIYIETTGPT